MSFLATSTLVTAAREEAPGNAETDKTGETSENGKNSKNEDKDRDSGTNLAQIPCIRYPMTDLPKAICVGIARLRK